MKKAILIFVSTIFLCGCSNKNEDSFSNYEHYDLKGKDIIYHKYGDENNNVHRYAIADITPDSYEIFVYGLFYQISADDYILLDKIESTQKKEHISKFQGNKLYVIGMGDSIGNCEYTLNQEKITKKELKFDFSQEFYPRTISKINENEIYYHALTNDEISGNNIYIELKCSLSTYKCELNE